MAFGTWLKGLISNVGSVIKKALPVAKKVVETVAPAAQKLGGLIGGRIGTGIQKVAGAASGVIDTAQSLMNGSSSLSYANRTGMVGANGGGIRRLTPILKS